MHPVFFTIGSFAIHTYGVMMALALLASVFVWHKLGERFGKYPGFASDVGIWLMVSGLLGARVAYVVSNFESHYRANPGEIWRIDQGGLIFYGGAIGSMLGMYIYSLLKREAPLPLADLVITPIPLAHALGRVGCFLNGCCFGREYEGFPHVFMANANRHPVQLYEAGLNLIVFGVLLTLFNRKRRDGVVFAAYLMLYPVVRFIIETFRGDERLRVGTWSVAQVVSVCLFAAGLAILGLSRRKGRAPAA
jgi:phosphatidylglycerol:prolipoprotein diacylglycerol transferase